MSENTSCAEVKEYVWISIGDVLDTIGVHRLQICVMLIAAIVYGHFSSQAMLASLVTPSVWEEWPELKDDKVVYNSIFAVAAFARLSGSILLVPLADRIGRYPIIFGATALSFILSIIGGLCNSFPLLVVVRGFVCFLTGALPSLATIYAVEMVQCRRRAIPSMLCQCFGALYVSYNILVQMALESGDNISPASRWRWASGLYEIPTSIAIIWFLIFRRDTPRFQLSVTENRRAAWKTLSKLCPEGQRGLQSKLLVHNGYGLMNEIKFIGIDDRPHAENATNKTWVPTYHIRRLCIDLREAFTSRDSARAAYVLGFIWIVQSFVHWGLNSYCSVFYAELGLNANLTNLLSFVLQLPVQALMYFLMTATFGGRILAIWMGAAVSGTLSVLVAILYGAGCRQSWLLTALVVGSSISGAPLWGPIYSYSAERFPTTMRSSIMGVYSALNALTTVATTYIGSLAISGSNMWILPLVWGLARLLLVPLALSLDKEVKDMELVDRNKIKR